MKERPIIFSGEQVRAILDGEKTQTRRVVNMDNLKVIPRHKVRGDFPFSNLEVKGNQKTKGVIHGAGAVSCKATSGKLLGLRPGEFDFVCPYADGKTLLDKSIDLNGVWRIEPSNNQRLWVRETFQYGLCTKSPVAYRATHKPSDLEAGWDEPIKWRPSIHMPRWASRITLEITSVRVERLQDISEQDANAEGGRLIDNLEVCYQNHRAYFSCQWDSINGKDKSKNWIANPWVWVIEFKRV